MFSNVAIQREILFELFEKQRELILSQFKIRFQFHSVNLMKVL